MQNYFSVSQDEVVDKDYFYPSLFDDKYIFSSAELLLNFRVFFTDFSLVTGDSTYPLDGRRFMHSSIIDALNQIQRHDVSNATISVLLIRSDCEKHEYVATKLVKVIKAKDNDNNLVYILYCKNNKKYIESNQHSINSEFHDKITIYRNTK